MIEPISGEPDLWRLWESRRLPAVLTTRDGQTLRILFPGLANTMAGPDFVGAVLAFERGPLRRGDVEVHIRASSWRAHGHYLDPRYNRVLLHVVLQDDGGVAYTEDKRMIPVVALGAWLNGPEEPEGQRGAGPCNTPTVARPAPDLVAQVIRTAGQERFLARAATWESEFATQSVADCVLRGLVRTTGLGRNREACEALAEALDGPTLEALLAATAGPRAVVVATAVLLGMSGLLEAAQADDETRRVWHDVREYWPGRPLDARRWQRFRVRPSNLPETRLRSLAGLIAQQGLAGLLERLVSLIDQEPEATTPVLVAALLAEDGTSGRAWALEAWANVLLPMLVGYGHALDRAPLAEGGERRYLTLPGGGDNRILARICDIAGVARPRLAVDQQGLLHIWSRYCSVQSCAQCPFMSRS